MVTTMTAVSDFASPNIYIPTAKALHWVVYDCETRRLGTEFGGLDKVREVGNWRDLGLTAMAVWDSAQEFCSVYDGFTVSEGVRHIEQADCVVSFNGAGFDNLLLQDLLGRHINLNYHFDILKKIKESGCQWKGNKLGEVCSRTVGLDKTGQGAHAPALAKQGRYGELFNYCLQDVFITRALAQHIRKEGWIIGPTLEKVELEVPEWFRL
jgi:hypothetical protein